MNQQERRIFLIKYLLKEGGYLYNIPNDETEQKRLLRSLMNVRRPGAVSQSFINVQDEYLKTAIAEKGITDCEDLNFSDDIAIWKGDITTIKADAIVNAANSEMLGCFCPCHGCIDNAIHTFAGVELRNECAKIMEEQGASEPTGKAKITKGYNLPAKHVIHTVGPIVYGTLTEKNRADLISCYESCLKVADENNLKSIVFCCISTGEFRFPNRPAAEIAVSFVKEYKKRTGSNIKVVFNVFKEIDNVEYKRLLGRD